MLFDEIEKAHPDVMNILLQILDEGKINDAQGRTVDFSNTVICMTSNAGSSDQSTSSLGFNKSEEQRSAEKTRKALAQFLRPEFLGRVDEVITFKPVSYTHLLSAGRVEYLEAARQRARSRRLRRGAIIVAVSYTHLDVYKRQSLTQRSSALPRS